MCRAGACQRRRARSGDGVFVTLRDAPPKRRRARCAPCYWVDLPQSALGGCLPVLSVAARVYDTVSTGTAWPDGALVPIAAGSVRVALPVSAFRRRASPCSGELRGANAERPQHAVGSASPRRAGAARRRAAWEASGAIGHGEQVLPWDYYGIVPHVSQHEVNIRNVSVYSLFGGL